MPAMPDSLAKKIRVGDWVEYRTYLPAWENLPRQVTKVTVWGPPWNRQRHIHVKDHRGAIFDYPEAYLRKVNPPMATKDIYIALRVEGDELPAKTMVLASSRSMYVGASMAERTRKIQAHLGLKGNENDRFLLLTATGYADREPPVEPKLRFTGIE